MSQAAFDIFDALSAWGKALPEWQRYLLSKLISTTELSEEALDIAFAEYLVDQDLVNADGPHKTIYNRFIRWSRMGVFNRIFAALAAKGGKPDQLMIDATHLKAHRTAASLLKKGMFPDVSDAPKVV